MTQNEDTVAPAQAPPVGTVIELDDRTWEVAEVTDPWVQWYIDQQSLRAPVYLVGDEGEWTVEGAAYVELYGTVVQP